MFVLCVFLIGFDLWSMIVPACSVSHIVCSFCVFFGCPLFGICVFLVKWSFLGCLHGLFVVSYVFVCLSIFVCSMCAPCLFLVCSLCVSCLFIVCSLVATLIFFD